MIVEGENLSGDTLQEGAPASEQLDQTPAETSAPETQEAGTAEAATGEGKATEQTEAEKAAAEKGDDKQPWYERRIAKQSAKLAEAIARNQEMERQLAAYAAGQTPSETAQAPLTPNDPVVLAAARQIAAAEAFNAECNRAFEAGKQAFPDFVNAVSTVQMVDGYSNSVIEAALATGAPADVLYQLGKNPDEAERIFSLPPVRMAVELGKLASTPKPAAPKPPISSAPPPIKPLNSKPQAVEKDPEKMSDAEWLEWRETQVAAKRRK